MMSRKDQGWQPLSNVMEEHREPFIEQKVQFRATGGGVASLSSSNKKSRRNLSSIKNTAPNTHVPSQFRNSPNRSNGAIPALIEESPEPKLFDSTIPHDKTWYSRVVQSTSLRQKHHLNQSIKLRKNLTEGITKEHPMLDMRTQIDLSKNESPMKYAVIQDVDLSREVSPEKGKPLSPIT